MSVFSRLGVFLNRHRNKFFLGGIVISGSILLSRYAQQKLKEWQQNEAKEFLDRTRKQHHFESTERTCNQTIINLTNPLNESLRKCTSTTDQILNELRDNPANKIELWETLKVLVFTKVTCLIYVSTMLGTLLRVQINVVGGYLFKDPNAVAVELQEKYLSICNQLLNSGMQKLIKLFEEKTKTILEAIPLNRQLKIDELEKIFWAIQANVKESVEDPVNNIKQYLISEKKTDESSLYNSMVQETADLLESEDVKLLMTSCISRGFVLLGDQISEFYRPVPSTLSSDEFVHPADVKIALAKLIPIINGLVSKNNLPNILVQQLIINEKLKTLGANVYEAFSYGNNNV